jgi:hypothetical protein
VPPVNAHHFQQDIAGSQLVIFPGLGHVPQEEDAHTSVAPVRAFLGLDAVPRPVPAAHVASEPASGARPSAAASPEKRSAEKS